MEFWQEFVIVMTASFGGGCSWGVDGWPGFFAAAGLYALTFFMLGTWCG